MDRQGGLGRLGEQMIDRINPINYTTVYVYTGIGIFFALVITFIAYAITPSRKGDPDTQRVKGNMMMKLTITVIVAMFSLLICGGLGYHQGKKISFCWANPKACAATTGASMLFDVFD
jgi:L-lactate permease